MTPQQSQPQPLPRAWIDRLFDRLIAIYGSKAVAMWRHANPDDVKHAWAEGLAGYSGEEIRRGLDACMARPYPPTLPEFARLCRPALDYEQAYLEAVEQMQRRQRGADRWSDPAIYWAAARIGSDLSAQPYQAIRSRWQAALDGVREDMRAGYIPAFVPPRAEALPAPGRTTNREVARQAISEALAKLTASKIVSDADTHPERDRMP